MGASTVLKKYITDENHKKLGVIIATFVEDRFDLVRVGWSVVHEDHKDEFDSYRGHQIAYGRVDKDSKRIIPQRIKADVLKIAGRAEAYFKVPVEIAGILVDDLDAYRKKQTEAERAVKALSTGNSK